MGDLGSDHDAAIELIIEEYRRLQRHDPNHELLQYISDVTDNGFRHVKERYTEFLDRFETPEDKKRTYVKVANVLVSYFVALIDAVNKIEGIDRSPKPKQRRDQTAIKTLGDIINEPLPF